MTCIYILHIRHGECSYGYRIIVILSIIVIASEGVGCTDVVCRHNGTYDLTFRDFVENKFLGHRT